MIQKLTLLFFITSALVFSSCKKNNGDTINTNFYVKAKKNGASWNSVSVEAFKNKGSDTITIISRAIPQGMKLPEESFFLVLKASGTGKYQPATPKTWFIKTLGLDVITDDYRIANNSSSTITVTDFNAINKTLKGTFNLSFKSERSTSAPSSDFELTDGSFYVKVVEN